MDVVCVCVYVFIFQILIPPGGIRHGDRAAMLSFSFTNKFKKIIV